MHPKVRFLETPQACVKTLETFMKQLKLLEKRANQISVEIKSDLERKLQEFSSNNVDSLEEVFENREQIEISKYYEQLPKPSLLAIQEYLEDKTYYRNPSKMK